MILAPLLVFALGACDLSVSNPGPTEDRFVSDPAAFLALANGAGRALGDAMGASTGSMGFTMAQISREIFPGGQTGSYGHTILQTRGFLDSSEVNGDWSGAHFARALAEEGVLRMRDGLGADFATSDVAAYGLLWVGYSNRFLGENVCDAVIDGGPAENFLIHFTRAEAAFTEALAVARAAGDADYENAALAGRASVRTWLGDWTGAVADAGLVPRDFEYLMHYNNLERSQNNSYFYAAQAPGSFRTITAWHTWYAENYDTFADPRTEYNTYADYPNTTGVLWDIGDGYGEYGLVPFYQSNKHLSYSSPIQLSDGKEAMLIVAEGRLRSGDWQGALDIINDIRAEVGVALRAATTSEETWTWLKLEKAIELWLESRWAGERRRWYGDGTDGLAPGPWPALHNMEDRPGRDRCIPISESEWQTNPNLQ
jgi:hypothetical protein